MITKGINISLTLVFITGLISLIDDYISERSLWKTGIPLVLLMFFGIDKLFDAVFPRIKQRNKLRNQLKKKWQELDRDPKFKAEELKKLYSKSSEELPKDLAQLWASAAHEYQKYCGQKQHAIAPTYQNISQIYQRVFSELNTSPNLRTLLPLGEALLSFLQQLSTYLLVKTQESQAALYWGVDWNFLHHRYFQRLLTNSHDYDQQSNTYVNNKVLRFLEKHSSNLDSLIDIGCGYGRLTVAFGKYFHSLTLVDPDDCIKTAEERVQDAFKEDKKLKCYQKQMALSNISEQYHGVICSHVLQHIETKRRNQMSEALPEYLLPDGILMFFSAISRNPKLDEYVVEGLSNYSTFKIPSKLARELREKNISAPLVDLLREEVPEEILADDDTCQLSVQEESGNPGCLYLCRNETRTGVYFVETARGFIGVAPREAGVAAKYSFDFDGCQESLMKEIISQLKKEKLIPDDGQCQIPLGLEFSTAAPQALPASSTSYFLVTQNSSLLYIVLVQLNRLYELNHICVELLLCKPASSKIPLSIQKKAKNAGGSSYTSIISYLMKYRRFIFAKPTAIFAKKRRIYINTLLHKFISELVALGEKIPAKFKIQTLVPGHLWIIEPEKDLEVNDRILVFRHEESHSFGFTYLPRQYYITKEMFDQLMTEDRKKRKNPYRALGTYRMSLQNFYRYALENNLKIKHVYYYHLLLQNPLLKFLFRNNWLAATKFFNWNIWPQFLKRKALPYFNIADVCILAVKKAPPKL